MIEEKQRILNYIKRNPHLTPTDIALHFSNAFDREVDEKMILQVTQEKMILQVPQNKLSSQYIHKYIYPSHFKAAKDLEFKQDLYKEACRRQSLTNENVTTCDKLRSLAFELAAHDKYEGFFSTYKFGRSWMYSFRKQFHLMRSQDLNRSKQWVEKCKI